MHPSVRSPPIGHVSVTSGLLFRDQRCWVEMSLTLFSIPLYKHNTTTKKSTRCSLPYSLLLSSCIFRGSHTKPRGENSFSDIFHATRHREMKKKVLCCCLSLYLSLSLFLSLYLSLLCAVTKGKTVDYDCWIIVSYVIKHV